MLTLDELFLVGFLVSELRSSYFMCYGVWPYYNHSSLVQQFWKDSDYVLNVRFLAFTYMSSFRISDATYPIITITSLTPMCLLSDRLLNGRESTGSMIYPQLILRSGHFISRSSFFLQELWGR